MELDGRVAVVTGGASGIGLALVEACAAARMRVVIADVEEPALDAAARRLRERGAEVLAVPTDVSDAAAVDALAAATFERFGTAHLVCNNAGVAGPGGPVWEVPIDGWRWTLDVNLWGVVHGVRAFVPRLVDQGEGHVVNTASAAGLVAPPYIAPYDAAKHAVVALSEAMLHELRIARSPVGVSVLCPEFVRTRIMDSERNRPARYGGVPAPDGGHSARRDAMRSLIEAGADPAEVAARVLDAVRAGRFWIVTHRSTVAGVRERLASIEEGRAPRSRMAERDPDA